MCICNTKYIVDTDHLIGYKVISVNKHGTKLPIFKLPTNACTDSYNEEKDSPYKYGSRYGHSFSAFKEEVHAQSLMNEIFKESHLNIHPSVTYVEIWRVELTGWLVSGRWTSSFEYPDEHNDNYNNIIIVLTGTEIKFLERLNKRGNLNVPRQTDRCGSY